MTLQHVFYLSVPMHLFYPVQQGVAKCLMLVFTPDLFHYIYMVLVEYKSNQFIYVLRINVYSCLCMEQSVSTSYTVK